MHILNDIMGFFIPIAHAQDSTAGQGVTELLGINWKLFIAQLVNFGIVFFILWKWAFTPLGKKLEERSAKIEQSMRDAEAVSKKLAEAEQFKLAEIQKARQEAADIVDKAQKSAVLAKEEIMAETRKASDKMLAQARAQLEEDKQKMFSEVKEQAAALVVLATEKIIREKLDQKKDEQLIKESLKSL